MNLLTPLAGFLIGYGGIMGYQVIDSTYKGEMPGPKYFGYFIGAMTLLSAGTIYALGRTDKVFNAEGDSCQNCESPSIQTTPLLDKWGEISEYKFCGSGCEGQYMRENKMLKAGFSWQGRRRKDEYEAQGLSQFTPDELTQSSAIHGDFDHASLNYSGHQNMIARAEWDDDRFTDEIICSVCSEPYDGTEVLDDYNAVIIHKRCAMKDSYEAETMMPENQCIICGGPYIGYGHNPEPIFPMSRGRCCDTCNATVVIPYRMGGMNFRFGEDFEAESVHRNRYNINRFSKKPLSMAGSKAATGVKRNIWKNLFRKNAEQRMADVRTMSGKPVSETLRKLKQDKNLSAKDARIRKEIKAENMEVFEAVSVNHNTYMEILGKIIKNQDRATISHDASLINTYGLGMMRRFNTWADKIGFSTWDSFTDVGRSWIEGDEISTHYQSNGEDFISMLKKLSDYNAKYQLATIVAKENSPLLSISDWIEEGFIEYRDVISLDEWDYEAFVRGFLATEEEMEEYYTEERLTLGSKNVSMILNLGGMDDDEFIDELNPRSGKIPRNLPTTAALLDYLKTNAADFPSILQHNNGLFKVMELKNLYGWSFTIHPARKNYYEGESFIEWQLKRAIPAKKRHQIKLDAQKEVRELRAKYLSGQYKGGWEVATIGAEFLDKN